MRREPDLENLLALYLRDITAIPLLTAADEVRLARDIEAGLIADERLGGTEPLTPEDRADLANLVEQGARSKALLIESNLRLVVCLAKAYIGCGTPLLDLIQEGNIGLMRAVEKFDYRRGNKFSTYASWWIRQAIARGFGDQNRTIRIPVHVSEAIHRVRRHQLTLVQELGRDPSIDELSQQAGETAAKVLDLLRFADVPVSLDLEIGDEEGGGSTMADLVADESDREPQNEIAQQSMRREVEHLLRTLGARDQQVLQLRFGLRGCRIHTLEEVGQQLGVTRERVRQIEARALTRIRSNQGAADFREYIRA